MLERTNLRGRRYADDAGLGRGIALTMMGLLHANTAVDGSQFSYRRQVQFTRADYPIDELQMEGRSSAECDAVCARERWSCPDRLPADVTEIEVFHEH